MNSILLKSYLDTSWQLLFLSDNELPECVVTIVRKCMTRLLEATNIKPGMFSYCVPDYVPPRKNVVHNILPERDDDYLMALSYKDIQLGDPENKMFVLVDRLAAGIAALPDGDFYMLYAPTSIDMAFNVMHLPTCLIVRFLQGYDVRQNLYIMGMSVGRKS